MKCEYCENEVPNGAMRCHYCGGPVSSNASGQRIVMPVDSAGARSTEELNRRSNHAVPSRGKNKLVFILLGLFLGGFGIHNFYAGYIARGMIKVLITFVSFGLLFWISWIWAIVEVCTVRIDAVGYPFES